MAFTPVITSAGVAAAIAANNLGLDLQITHIALGAGVYNPTGSETALQDRRETAAVGPGSRTDGDTITINAVLPSSAYVGAAYNIGEVGFFAGNPASGGTLFAVASASGESFGSRSSVVADFVVTITMTLQGVPAGSVTVTVDENAGASFKLIEEHEAAGNPHPQYRRPVGEIVAGVFRVEPPGTVEVKGQWLSRTTYSDLWAYVQDLATAYPELLITDAAWAAGDVGVRVAFSTGDGSTTFRMPDYRGLHPRYWEGARSSPSVNPGRALGSYEGDGLLEHSHTLSALVGSGTTPPGLDGDDSGAHYAPGVTGSTGGAENRVKTVALRVCMVY